MFADSRYADIEKKCRYADIADADINIGTPLSKIQFEYGICYVDAMSNIIEKSPRRSSILTQQVSF